MKIGPDCIPCILKMCLGYIRRTGLEDGATLSLFKDILQIPSLRGVDWTVTSPEAIEKVMVLTYDMLGNEDPLKDEKVKLNRYLMDRYETFERLVRTSHDPLETAVKLAIMGNAIDVMVSLDFKSLLKKVQREISQPLPEKQFAAFRDRLGKAGSLIYFGDNAGEIVMDKLLISILKEYRDLEITYVVRSLPTLNDATLKDAFEVRIDEVACLKENGISGPFPGTRIVRCSGEIQGLFERSDLVISKGGGNFDSLDEDKGTYGKDISFLFLSKCYLYMSLFGTIPDGPILANHFNGISEW